MRSILGSLFFIVILSLPLAAQKPTASPSPTPQPIPFWDYTVVENSPADGKRVFVWEMELGKKWDSKKLRAELADAKIPVQGMKSTGISVYYPAGTSDCQILGDAKRAAEIAAQYLDKKVRVRFNQGFMVNDFYQDLPPCVSSGAAPPPGAALFSSLYILSGFSSHGLIKSKNFAIIVKLQT